MPFVTVRITPGVSREKKALLVEEITDTLVRLLGKNPDHTHIVIDEIEMENWGFGGKLTDEFLETT